MEISQACAVLSLRYTPYIVQQFHQGGATLISAGPSIESIHLCLQYSVSPVLCRLTIVPTDYFVCLPGMCTH